MPLNDSNKPKRDSDSEQKRVRSGNFRTILGCLVTVAVCGGVMGLIGGTGNFFQRTGNGAFILFIFIVGLFVQMAIGGLIGKVIARTDEGALWGGGIAAALYVFGIFPLPLDLMEFFKIKAPF